MSFNYYARRVRSPSRLVWHRLQSLRSCVATFSWLSGTSFTATVEHFGLDWRRDERREPPTDEFLLATLDQVERARNLYLERLRVFDSRRVRAKVRGRRQLSNAERAMLRTLLPGAPFRPSRGWLLRNARQTHEHKDVA